jgi:hypothetical protein
MNNYTEMERKFVGFFFVAFSEHDSLHIYISANLLNEDEEEEEKYIN